ncbi:MAG: hypothetical protein JWN37_265 [Candidatus Nomurabacteria bacterium]|nr:hypothetical protein [Candidatus Nomurabacteria bacterium]
MLLFLNFLKSDIRQNIIVAKLLIILSTIGLLRSSPAKRHTSLLEPESPLFVIDLYSTIKSDYCKIAYFHIKKLCLCLLTKEDIAVICIRSFSLGVLQHASWILGSPCAWPPPGWHSPVRRSRTPETENRITI